jgi:cell division inhibitor SepF
MSLWRRTAMYLGLVDDDEYEDYDEYDTAPARPAESRGTERQTFGDPRAGTDRGYAERGSYERTVERVSDGGRDVSGIGAVRTIPRDEPQSASRPTVVRTIASPTPKVHLVEPKGFNDAQEVGDRLKAGQPVILNLQGIDRGLQRRLVDFASGLAYALNGSMAKAAEQVFLLAPANVEVSQEDKARALRDRGVFQDDED